MFFSILVTERFTWVKLAAGSKNAVGTLPHVTANNLGGRVGKIYNFFPA